MREKGSSEGLKIRHFRNKSARPEDLEIAENVDSTAYFVINVENVIISRNANVLCLASCFSLSKVCLINEVFYTADSRGSWKTSGVTRV